MEGDSEVSSPDDQVIAALEATGVPYQRVDIDPEYADTAAFCEQYGYGLEVSANTIIVASKRGEKVYSANVVLATCRLDVNKKVKAMMGVSKVSFASAEETRELTGMEIGGVTPFGLPDGLPLFVDARVMELEKVILGAGSREWKVFASPEILRHSPGFQIVEDLAKPIPPAE